MSQTSAWIDQLKSDWEKDPSSLQAHFTQEQTNAAEVAQRAFAVIQEVHKSPDEGWAKDLLSCALSATGFWEEGQYPKYESPFRVKRTSIQ